MTTEQGEEWGPLRDLVELFKQLAEHETSEADKRDAEYRAEDNGDDDEERMDPESWGFRRAADAFKRCADELKDMVPALARKVEEEKREARLDEARIWKQLAADLRSDSLFIEWAKQRIAELEKRA